MGSRESHLERVPSAQADADLLRRAAAGDRLAFQILYLRHRQSVLDLIAKRYRWLGSHVAEDVVSEASLLAWQDHEQLGAVNSFRGYFKGIAKNLIARRYRAHRADEASLFFANAVSPTLSPDGAMERAELTRRVNQALTSIAEARRVAFELAEQGLSAKQIASLSNCTENAARRRVQKARQDLARALSRCGDACAVDQRRLDQCPAKKENLYCLKSLFQHELHAEV